MSFMGAGGPMRRPVWLELIEPNPDYNGRRVVIVDTQTIFDLIGRGPKRDVSFGMLRWNDELSWLFNSPATEVQIKMNDQVYDEVAGANAMAKASAQMVREQREFIDAYRLSGKIFLDSAPVPHFASGRLAAYVAVRNALKATGNLGAGDLLIAADGITNRLRIITHDVRFIEGVDKAVRSRGVKAALKAYGLPDDIARIFISPTRSGL